MSAKKVVHVMIFTVLAVTLLGATAQVTLKDFGELQKRVDSLEHTVTYDQVPLKNFGELQKRVDGLEQTATYNKANLRLLQLRVARLEKGTTAPAPTPAATTKPAAPPSVSRLQFATIRKNMNSMTKAQWKKYAESLKGTRVSWSGWVEGTTPRLLGRYELWIDMDPPPDGLSIVEITFDLSPEVALALQRDQRVRFTGTIWEAANAFGACMINLSDAQLY